MLNAFPRRFTALTLCVLTLFLCIAALAEGDPAELTAQDLNSKAAILMDMESGTVLFERNPDRKTWPASTTKIMTCMLAIENCSLDETVKITPEANKVPADSSKMGLTTGEEMTMADLLYGMMMKSGNDAAIAVAIHVSGSVDAFVDRMNQRAKELGCTGTHFVNPHGYHDTEHYSTARDLALIARQAMQYDAFREIVAAKSYTLAATNQREKKRLETENPMFVATSQYYYPNLIGIKTGYHSKAGRCFVGAASESGVTLISVTLRGSARENSWKDTAKLLDYGFSRYRTYSFPQLYSYQPVYASIQNANRDDPNAGLLELSLVSGGTIDGYKARALPDQVSRLVSRVSEQIHVEYSSDLVAPIQKGDILGTLTLNDETGTYTGVVVASRDVAAEPKPFSLESLLPEVDATLKANMLRIALIVLLLLILLIVIVSIRRSVRNNRRRRELARRRAAAYRNYRPKR